MDAGSGGGVSDDDGAAAAAAAAVDAEITAEKPFLRIVGIVN